MNKDLKREKFMKAIGIRLDKDGNEKSPLNNLIYLLVVAAFSLTAAFVLTSSIGG